MDERISKKKVVELATQQSQNAQAVTRALRAHGWKTYIRTEADENGRGRAVPVESDDEYRHGELREALEYARLVERDARAIRSWVEEFARQEGALQQESATMVVEREEAST